MIERLTVAARQYKRDRERLEKSREALAETVIEATREGVPQVEIVRATGWTREQVRLIVRKAEDEGRL